MHAKKMRITFYYCIRFKSTIIFYYMKNFSQHAGRIRAEMGKETAGQNLAGRFI